VPQARMRVFKYIPMKMYGFCQDTSGFEVFFHLAAFHPGPSVEVVHCSTCASAPSCLLTGDAPPPILGEPVEVNYDPHDSGTKAPRASQVSRLVVPTMIVGMVESFDTQRRYGFIKGSNGTSYHLHESEVIDGRLPMAGRQVVFYPGIREGRPRACHIRVCK